MDRQTDHTHYGNFCHKRMPPNSNDIDENEWTAKHDNNRSSPIRQFSKNSYRPKLPAIAGHNRRSL